MGAPRIAFAIKARLAVGTLALCTALPGAEGTAHAQQAAAPAPAPATAPAAAPDRAKMEEARRHFDRGLQLLRDPEGEKVESAYGEFKAAYELSHSPRVLGNIGYCAMRMERNSESVAAYREYLRLVPDVDPAERAQINQDLNTLADGAATVKVGYSSADAWTLIDERTPVQGAVVTNVYSAKAGETLPLLIHPGRHVLHAKVNGEEQSRWEIDAPGGSSQAHTFEPKPATPTMPVVVTTAPEKPVSRVPQIALMGTGGVLVAVSVFTGIAAYSKMKSLERECPNNLCTGTGYRDEVDSARGLGTATDVLLIGGAAIFAAGAIWYAVTPSHRESDVPAVTASCVPNASGTACAFTMRGAF